MKFLKDPTFKAMCYAACGYWCGVLSGWLHSDGYGGWITIATFGVVLNPFIWFDDKWHEK